MPKGWEWCRLGTVSELLGGYAFKSESLKSSIGKRVIRISDIGENRFVDKRIVRYNGNDISDAYSIHSGDILMAMTGGTVGKSLFVKFLPEELLLNQRVAAIRCYCVEKSYLSQVLKAPHILYVISESKNSTNDNISMGDIYDFLIPIPPVSEQQRIVTKLQELEPLIERYGTNEADLSKLNASINELLKKSILQEAIQGKLVPQIAKEGTATNLLDEIKAEKQKLVKAGKLKKSALAESVIFKGDDNKYYERVGNTVTCIEDEIPFEIPNSWSWVRLRGLCSIMTGATFKKEDAKQDKNGVRILRGGNIYPFEIKFKEDDIFLSESQVKSDILLKQNDLITPAVTSLENICKMARVVRDMESTTVGGFVFILRPYLSNDTQSAFLLAVLSAPSTVEFVKSITNKSGQAFYNIGKERLGTTLIPLPPTAEQNRIVQRINELLSKL